jgi:putative ABC transport system permease protein
MRFSFRLPLRFLRGNYARLTLSVIALALGVALVCAIDLVNRAVLRAFSEVIDTMAGRAALQVSAGEGGLFAESAAATIAEVPGVELAVPVVTSTAFTADETGELLTVHGVDIANEAAVRVYESRDQPGFELDDPLVFLNQPDSVLLTQAFAQRRGLSVDQVIVLDTPSGRRSFTIRGLLDPKGVARVYGGNLVVMDLPAAQLAFAGVGLVNRVDVVLAADRRADMAADDIRKILPSGLKVEAPAQRRADLNRVMHSLQVLLQAMGLVGLVAAFLIAFSRLGSVFESRAWQLGVLRAGGVRRRALWWELMKESAALGAAGVVLGIPLGIGAAQLLLPVIAKTAALNYKLIAPEVTLRIGLPSLALAAALGLGAACLAAALPAWRMSGVAVIETIRGRGVAQEGSWRLMWAIRAAVVAGIGVAIAMQSVTRIPVWGMVATVFIAAGTALAAQPLLRFSLNVIASILTFAVGPVARFAVAMFAQNARRAALTAAMLGVGIGSIVWLRTVAYSFQLSLTDALSAALQGDLVVTSSHIASGYVEAPLQEQVSLELRNVPGVGEVVGERLVDWHYEGGPIAIDAFDSKYFTGGRFGRWRLLGSEPQGIWDDIAAGEAVLVSSSFVLNLGTPEGSTIELETPSGPVRLRIAGVTTNFSSPRGTIVMSREVYKRLWRDAQVNRVFVNAAPGADMTSLRDAIGRQLGRKYSLRILTAAGLLEYFTEQVQQAFAPIGVLAVLVLLVVLVGLADTLGAGVVERVRELGAMRALGARRRHLSRMIIAEGFALGTLGLILAASAGILLGTLWVRSTFPYLLGWSLEVYVPYEGLAIVVVATMAVCLAAVVWPARRAAKLEPATALRYE